MSVVQHPQGDTLVLSIPVTGIPSGETIEAARIFIGTAADPVLDAAMSVNSATVSVTVPAATTNGWALGLHDLEAKVKLTPSGQISRVVSARLKVVESPIGNTVP